MSGAIFLALAHAQYHALRSALLVLCVFVAALLPMGTRVLVGDFQTRLLSRARSTPLLAGCKGSRFDLVMAGLYFRKADIGTLTMRDWREFADSGLADAIPLHARFTARGQPLVATSPDYFDLRKLRPASGTLPGLIGEVVLGASAAEALGLKVGDAVFSDQREMFDISKPPALKMRVVGVLSPSGAPDDEALFVDIKTAWVLEGLAHGHADASTKIPDPLVLDRTGGNVVVSEEFVDYNEFTPETLRSFHIHADPESLPITAVVLAPHSDKDLSILKARTNAGKSSQIVVPEQAVGEMLGYVARLKQLLDGLSVVILSFTLVLIGLVTALSVRVRAREVETLTRIGASRATISAIFGWEIALILSCGCLLAAAATIVIKLYPPELVKFL